MYTTSPKLLGKIRPLHDLLHKEFVQKVLTAAPKPSAAAAAAALDEELEEEIEALPMAAKYNRCRGMGVHTCGQHCGHLCDAWESGWWLALAQGMALPREPPER